MTEEARNYDQLNREAELHREITEAKIGSVWLAIDGIRAVLERVTVSVEKQAEQNTQVALIANTVSHFQQSFVEHRAHAEDTLADHSKRIVSLEERAKVNEWGRKGLWAAIGVGIAATGTFLTANFDKLIPLIG